MFLPFSHEPTYRKRIPCVKTKAKFFTSLIIYEPTQLCVFPNTTQNELPHLFIKETEKKFFRLPTDIKVDMHNSAQFKF